LAFDFRNRPEDIKEKRWYIWLSALVTDKLFSAILDKSIRAQAFWQEIANNKTQKTNNNQIQNINDQKIAYQ